VRNVDDMCGEMMIVSYLTAGLASLFVSEFVCVCERGYGDYGGCCRCCLLVRVDVRHLNGGVQELGAAVVVFMLEQQQQQEVFMRLSYRRIRCG
jgi:hypothetical protein